MHRSLETGTDTVRIEVADGVGVMTFNRPERRNALHDEMYAPMIAAVEEFAASPDVGCVVVTGEGSAFCAGGDVRDGSGRRAGGSPPAPEERVANLVANARLSVVLHEAQIVTIAAVNGPAVGAGFSIALACDLRIAAESATFLGGWARLGFSGDFGGAWLLARRVGPSKALEILAANRSVSATEALQIGLVDRMAPTEEFDQSWRAWAAELAAGPRQAIGLMKANIVDSRLQLSDAIAVEAERMVASAQTADHREAVRAWIEKRPPRFGSGGAAR
jgi:2-(1,2-epoxy-1,2-dihydrophenyl)acetyl-CoA isomerase